MIPRILFALFLILVLNIADAQAGPFGLIGRRSGNCSSGSCGSDASTCTSGTCAAPLISQRDIAADPLLAVAPVASNVPVDRGLSVDINKERASQRLVKAFRNDSVAGRRGRDASTSRARLLASRR